MTTDQQPSVARQVTIAACIAGVLVVILVVAAMFTSHARDSIDGVLYWPSYHRGQVALISSLKDPDSAKLRGLYFHRHAGIEYLCGQVNARNAMGGYVGYTDFYVARLNDVLPEVQISDGNEMGAGSSVRFYCSQ